MNFRQLLNKKCRQNYLAALFKARISHWDLFSLFLSTNREVMQLKFGFYKKGPAYVSLH